VACWWGGGGGGGGGGVGTIYRGGVVVVSECVVFFPWFREAKKLLADQDPNWTGSTGTIHLQCDDDGDIYLSVYPAIQSNSSSTGIFPIPGILGTRAVGYGIERYVAG